MSTDLSSLPPDVVQSLLAAPAGPPPPGVVPDFSAPNPFSPRTSVLICAFTLPISVAAVCARTYFRAFVSDGLTPEDYIMFFVLLCEIGLNALNLTAVYAGFGKHVWNIPLHHYLYLIKYIYAYAVIYVLCLALLKIIILLQITRIFGVNRRTRIVCWIWIIIIAVCYIIIFFVQTFVCTPVGKYWDPFRKGHCLNVENLNKAAGVVNGVSDFVVFVIPIPLILKLHMTTRKKLLVATVFATGAFACAFSILRAYYTWQVFDAHDANYYYWFLGTFCSMEVFSGVMVFCMPVAPGFYYHIKSLARNASKRMESTAGSDGRVEPSQDNLKKSPGASRQPYVMPSLASWEDRRDYPMDAVHDGSHINDNDQWSSSASKLTQIVSEEGY